METSPEGAKDSRQLLLKISLFERRPANEPLVYRVTHPPTASELANEEVCSSGLSCTTTLPYYDEVLLLGNDRADAQQQLAANELKPPVSHVFPVKTTFSKQTFVKTVVRPWQRADCSQTPSTLPVSSASSVPTWSSSTSSTRKALLRYYTQQAKGTQFINEMKQNSAAVQATTTNYLTVAKPEKPEVPRSVDSIMDFKLSGPLSMSMSVPSLSTAFPLMLCENHSAGMQTEGVQRVDKTSLTRSASWTSVSMTRSRIATGIFPVLSPSGEQIGALVGAALTRPTMPAKWQTPSFMRIYRGLTKTFVAPMSSMGIQVDMMTTATSSPLHDQGTDPGRYVSFGRYHIICKQQAAVAAAAGAAPISPTTSSNGEKQRPHSIFAGKAQLDACSFTKRTPKAGMKKPCKSLVSKQRSKLSK